MQLISNCEFKAYVVDTSLVVISNHVNNVIAQTTMSQRQKYWKSHSVGANLMTKIQPTHKHLCAHTRSFCVSNGYKKKAKKHKKKKIVSKKKQK